ncbi:MAG: hypothetical protein CM15mP115_12220 [Alphaproteobacteria bacterium]|nr:MAG: hypothetical protein CM15mP115_12220 [Alphaproteobacteria bacterium]
MARRRKERSLGEMISTICFYLVGVYFVLKVWNFAMEVLSRFGIWASGLRVSPAFSAELGSDC